MQKRWTLRCDFCRTVICEFEQVKCKRGSEITLRLLHMCRNRKCKSRIEKRVNQYHIEMKSEAADD